MAGDKDAWISLPMRPQRTVGFARLEVMMGGLACGTLSTPRHRRVAREARLGGEADRGVGGAEAPVAAPLHDLEEETLLERAGVDLQVFGVAVTVVEDVVRLQLVDALRRQVGLGFEIVVVVLRNAQQRDAVRLKARDRRRHVAG